MVWHHHVPVRDLIFEEKKMNGMPGKFSFLFFLSGGASWGKSLKESDLWGCEWAHFHVHINFIFASKNYNYLEKSRLQ